MLDLHRVRRLVAPSDLRLRMRAFVALALVDVALRAVGLQRLMGQVQPAHPLETEHIASVEEIRRAQHYADVIEATSRHHVVRSQCLQRSLVLHRWLHRESIPSELRIGVRKDNGELKAHAWVELGGQVVNDRLPAVRAFSPLDRTPLERQASAPCAHPPSV
jgi:hypothetical protein